MRSIRRARGTFFARCAAVAGASGAALWGLAVSVAPASGGLDNDGNVDVVAAKGTAQQTMPAELRASYIAAVQADAPAAYDVERVGAVHRAMNGAQKIASDFSRDGVSVAPAAAEGAWNLAMSPSRYGCADDLAALGGAEPEAVDNRVEYRRTSATGESIVEWYVNGPLGLEQGFTVASAPPCRAQGGGELTVELAIGGDVSPRMSPDGKSVELRSARDEVVARYEELHVADARGMTVPSRLELAGGRVSILVDDTAAAYPLVIDPLITTLTAKIVPADAQAGDDLGVAIAISGDTAIVGSYLNDDLGSNAGAAYVFIHTGGEWVEQTKLHAANGFADSNFGFKVDIEGDTAVIGAPGFGPTLASQVGYGINSRAYVFVRSGGVWTQQAELVSSTFSDYDALCGHDVALSGETVVVACPMVNVGEGRAVVYARSGSTWTEQATLAASDAHIFSNFADSAAIDGDTIAIGRAFSSQLGQYSGSAYVYMRTGTTWTERQRLLASDGVAADNFGCSVALSGGTLIVGAQRNNVGAPGPGKAYVYGLQGGVWVEEQQLAPSDGQPYDHFGYGLSMDGDRVIVGAYAVDDNGTDSGAAYIFTRSGGVWSEQTKLRAFDGAAGDVLGVAVALSGSELLVGAQGADNVGLDSGAVYYFCPDTDGDGVCDADDPIDNCPNVANADQADMDGDGVGDACDNCPAEQNADQVDVNGNGVGDACEGCAADADSDGICDDVDTCPFLANPAQLPDMDCDGILDPIDNCPTVPNPGQQDTNGNGIGNACDTICVTLTRGPGQPASIASDAALAFDVTDPTRGSTNYGLPKFLNTGSGPGLVVQRSLLKFDLSSIPSSALLVSSKLTLRKNTSIGAGTVQLHNVLAPWAEMTVTWNNFNNAFDPAVLASIVPSTLGHADLVTVDLTGITHSWLDGSLANYGVLLDETGPGRAVFGGSEAPVLISKPSLAICYWPGM